MTAPVPEEIQHMMAVAREFLHEADDNAERHNVRSAVTASYYAVNSIMEQPRD